MKTRTIEEIHDKEIGHKKFAWFVDTAIEDGHKITEIKEYNENEGGEENTYSYIHHWFCYNNKFKFKMDGMPLEFDKMPNLSVKWQLDLCYQLLWYRNKLEEMRNGKKSQC